MHIRSATQGKVCGSAGGTTRYKKPRDRGRHEGTAHTQIPSTDSFNNLERHDSLIRPFSRRSFSSAEAVYAWAFYFVLFSNLFLFLSFLFSVVREDAEGKCFRITVVTCVTIKRSSVRGFCLGFCFLSPAVSGFSAICIPQNEHI